LGCHIISGFNLHFLDDTRDTRSAKLKPQTMTSDGSEIDEKPHVQFFQKISINLNKT